LAKKTAKKVKSECLIEYENIKKNNGDAYWVIATLGEACLILSNIEEAKKWYKLASDKVNERWGDLSSTRSNANLLINNLKLSKDIKSSIEECFLVPKVIVFAGHMIDSKNRKVPRFPKKLEKAIEELIDKHLKKVDRCIGFAAAACGSDILFLEVLKNHKGKVNVVLPSKPELFSKASVVIDDNTEWVERYKNILDSSAEITIIGAHASSLTASSYEYSNKIMYGLARIKANHLETKLSPLVVWDSHDVGSPGGTSSVINNWKNLGLDVDVIDLAPLLKKEFPNQTFKKEVPKKLEAVEEKK